jgi:hypothetical protein
MGDIGIELKVNGKTVMYYPDLAKYDYYTGGRSGDHMADTVQAALAAGGA